MNAAQQVAVQDAVDRIMLYLQNPTQGRMFKDLMAALDYVPNDRVFGLSVSRVLDYALQRLRRSRRIKFEAKIGWSLA